MKALGFLLVVGIFALQTQFASAGNINPMSQRYNANSFSRHPTARQEQRKPPQRQRLERQDRQGGSQY